MGIFRDFLGGLISTKSTRVSTFGGSDEEDQLTRASIIDISNAIAQNYIAGIISKLDFQTISRNKKLKGEEWYLWNFEPNPNQSASEFKAQLVKTLLKKGSVLVVELGGYLYIANSYRADNAALLPTTFSDVEILAKDKTLYHIDRSFTMSEVLFFQLDDPEIRKLQLVVDNEYKKLFDVAQKKYQKAGGHRGIVKLGTTARGDVEKQEKQRKAILKQFQNYYNSENGLAVLPQGMEYSENTNTTSSTLNEVQNMKTLIGEALAMTARAYKIPLAILSGDVADTKVAMDQMISTCIMPILTMIQTEITRKRIGKTETLKGSKVVIDPSGIKYTDAFSVSANIDKLIADGIYSIDEIREKIGEIPIGESWSQKHYITKNYSDISETTVSGGKVS